MALEQVFSDSHALKRLRQGPLASVLDGFCEWLSKLGFARLTIRSHISNLSHFNRYLEHQKLKNLGSLNSDHIQKFLTGHLPRLKQRRAGTKPNHKIVFSIHRFIEYLQQVGLIDTLDNFTTQYQAIVDEYIKWLRDYHDSANGTLMLRKQNRRVSGLDI